MTFEEQAVYYNTTAVRPAAVPTDDNKIFEAWWYKGDVFDFTTPIVSGIELSCHWKTLKENQAIVTYKDGNITEIFHAQNTYQPDYDKGGFTEDSFIYDWYDE